MTPPLPKRAFRNPAANPAPVRRNGANEIRLDSATTTLGKEQGHAKHEGVVGPTGGWLLALAALAIIANPAGHALGASQPTRPIALNQTDGFGNEKLLAFTYFQNFACIHEPFDDLDGEGHTGDGTVAAADPDEFQAPKCILGESGSGSLPTIDPTGRPIVGTEPLFVIVPFFDADGDGTVDALDPTPGVAVQCPEPASPLTVRPVAAPFGTCTMHPTTLHAEPAGLSDLPLVNHSHIIDGDNFGAIWWQIIAVLVFEPSIWPTVTGGCPAGGKACLTSVKALRPAQAAGQASGDVPTNFFLFFDARPLRVP